MRSKCYTYCTVGIPNKRLCNSKLFCADWFSCVQVVRTGKEERTPKKRMIPCLPTCSLLQVLTVQLKHAIRDSAKVYKLAMVHFSALTDFPCAKLSVLTVRKELTIRNYFVLTNFCLIASSDCTSKCHQGWKVLCLKIFLKGQEQEWNG